MAVVTQIKKRSGELVSFETSKITEALAKAGRATGEFGPDEAAQLTVKIVVQLNTLFPDEHPSVEAVQDLAEDCLLESRFKKTAKAYILYRDQHQKLRSLATAAELDLVDQYVRREDWQVKENSNMSYSLQGLNNYLAAKTSKTYWLNKIYSPEIRDAHQSGDFHLHDLGQLSVYCVGWDLMDLLRVGFKGVVGKTESGPARHFRTALGQIVNFFYTLQGEAAGAQAFSNFDTLLAPFIRHDGLEYEQVKQALQEFVFNLNVPTRVGFQTPFTNITLDLTVPGTYRDEHVVIGGETQLETYADYQEEMNVLNRAFLEVMAEGDASGRVFTFPIPTYNVTKDFDWENPVLEDLWRSTAKYGIPYFANFINSDLDPDDARSMCCRLRLDTRELENKGGGLFGANPLTGSIGVVTLNLPRLGYLAKDEDDFFARLDNLMLLAKESLTVKRRVLEDLTDSGLYPYTKFYLRDIQARNQRYWKNHFSTIGIVGMNEAIENLFNESISSPLGQDFAERVLSFMRERMSEYQEETGEHFNLEATPAEATSYRLAQLDRDQFPAIKVANQSHPESPYYTNSTHLPVGYTSDVFEALELQDHLQVQYTGGTVLHLFAGEQVRDTQTVKNLVRRICENYHLPYFTLTPTFSICPVHGYISGEHHACPSCSEATEVYSRVVGYLRPVSQWNDGKQAEFIDRQTYTVEEKAKAADSTIAQAG